MGNSQKHVIELNGKKYDAVSGVLIDVRQSSHVVATPTTATKTTAPKIDHSRSVTRITPHRLKVHAPERTETLMRNIVKKPAKTVSPAIKVTTHTASVAITASTISALEHKIAADVINPVRLAHANHVQKSPHIKRFTVKQPFNEIAYPSHIRTAHPRHAAEATLTTPSIAYAPLTRAQALFETAMTKATSHEQPLYQAAVRSIAHHKRLVNALAGVATLLVIASFITFLNMPAFELRIASVHAGFSATTPSYRMSGYALENGIRASKGRVEMTYRSGKNSYTVTQVASAKSNTDVLDETVEQRGAPNRTIQNRGRTIYLYNNSAVWANSGITYSIDSTDSTLQTYDLISLATSM